MQTNRMFDKAPPYALASLKPDVEPSETDLAAPRSGEPALYKQVGERFPEY